MSTKAIFLDLKVILESTMIQQLDEELTHYTFFVWGDGSTLDSNVVFLDGHGGIDGDLVVGLVTVRKTQVIV